MKELNDFVFTDYSRLMCLRYGECLETIEPYIFSRMLRSLSKYETQEGKIAFLERTRDRPKSSEVAQALAQLGLRMQADDRFHEILKEYDRES